MVKSQLLSRMTKDIDELPFKNYIYAALTIDVVAILFVLLVKGRLPPQVPLYYGLPQGEEQLVGPFGLLIPPAASIAFTGINILLARFIKDDFLKKILAASSLVTSVFAAITIFKIAFLVGNI